MPSTALTGIGLRVPVIAAPMAGGPSTPALVTAAAKAGGLGFLAAGYKTPDLVAEQIAEVRRSGVPFGVNVFAPNPIRVDLSDFRRYATAIAAEAARYGLDTTSQQPVEDDDHWAEKVDLLRADPVPLVSFTFGFPERPVIDALRRAGTIVVLTVTSAEEASAATATGADVLAVQASAAGGHSGTLTPQRIPPAAPLLDLLAQVRAATALPLLAAGGLASAQQVAAVIRDGAQAAVVGTALLRSAESGASPAYQAALADANRGATVVTRAFTGRPARALRNGFIDRYDNIAPSGYPAIHHLTSPLRKAAAAARDPERINLWAGTGYRAAVAGPAADLLTKLVANS